jgi:acyl-coenzyme A thioesterase PaaI-like protein
MFAQVRPGLPLGPGRWITSAGVTDISDQGTALPNRLGVTLTFRETGSGGEELVWQVHPREETVHHGVVRLSVLAYAADAVAGMAVDSNPEVWTFTSDLSIRMRPVPAPERIDATGRILRQGRRSCVTDANLVDEHGAPVAYATLGFAHVARREGDPPKPDTSMIRDSARWPTFSPVEEPVRQAAGIEVVDAAAGVVEVSVTPQLCNPAGAMQGAMVALVAEAAAEELLAHRVGGPALVTDMDIRYLAQGRSGPIRTRTEVLGAEPTAPLRVELVDTSSDRVITHVLARGIALDEARPG